MNIDEQNNRTLLRDNKLNYSVVAGAGAGKTTMLSHRISNQIKAGEALESFVVITYTNVAAEELRGKIVDVLCEMEEKEKLGSEEAINVRNALENIDLLQISTIHSFLFRLLRENCFEAGLSMDARKLEPDEDESRKKRFFKEWKNKHYSEIKQFRADWQIPNSQGEIKDKTLEVLENMFMDMASVREEVKLEPVDLFEDFCDRAKAIYSNWYKGILQFGKEVRDNVPCKEGVPQWYNPAKQVNADIIELEKEVNAKAVLEDQDYIDIAIRMMNIFILANSGKDNFYGHSTGSKPWKNHLEKTNYIKDRIPSGYTLEDEKLPEEYSKYCNNCKAISVAQYVIKMQEAFQQMTDSEVTCISDDDILYRAKKLLQNNPDLLNKLRDKYTKIYLDEAQDTTYMQLDIIKFLAGKSGSDLDNLSLKEDGLVVVGDPKQSIYRFTGAEKEVYDGINNQIDGMSDTTAQKIMLKENFRSNNLVVDWVNARYADMINACKDEPMTTDWKVNNIDTLCGVYLVPDIDGYDVDTDVNNVVGLVKYLTTCSKFQLEEYDRKRDTYSIRNIKYSDFLILTKTTTKLGDYVKGFNNSCIPVKLEGKFSVKDEYVLKDFIQIIKYVDNKKSNNHIVTAAKLKLGSDITVADKSLVDKMKKELGEMCYKFKQENMRVGAIVNYLLTHTELYLEKNRTYSAVEVNTYKTKLRQMVDTCLSGNTSDLTSLTKAMENYVDNLVGREMSLDPNEDAVRIMNVHKAKGLTGKIVIVTDRRNGEEPKLAGFRSKGKYYPSARYNDQYNDGTKLPTYNTITNPIDMRQKAIDDENDENTRLEYVAATRAAHALIVMPVICDQYGKRPEKVWFDNILSTSKSLEEWINSCIAGVAKKHTITSPTVSNAEIITIDRLDNNLNRLNGLEPTQKEKLTNPTLISLTPSGLESGGISGYHPDEKGYKSEDRPRGNIFGNVTHRSFELVVNSYGRLKSLEAEGLAKSIETIIKRAILENKKDFGKKDDECSFMSFLKPVVMDYFHKIITPIMDDVEIVDGNPNGYQAYPEYSFGFYIPKSELEKFKTDFAEYMEKAKIEIHGDRVWVNGQMDLVVKTKSGRIKIYDYKSDGKYGKPDEEYLAAMKAKYKGQFELYRSAASRIFDVPLENVDEVKIIHFYMEGLD